MTAWTDGYTNIPHRMGALMDQPEDRLRSIAAVQLHEIGLLHSLVELMALAVPRTAMPAPEGGLLDAILENRDDH